MPSQSFREEFVRSNYGKIPVKEIAEKLGVSEATIQRTRAKIGLDPIKSSWSTYPYSKLSVKRSNRESLVREYYGKMPLKELAVKVGVSTSSIKRIRKRIGIPVIANRGATPEMKQFVRANYGKMPVQDIAKELGITPGTVSKIRMSIGIAPSRYMDCYTEYARSRDYDCADITDFDELSVCQVVEDRMRMPLRGADLYEAVRRMHANVQPEIIAWRLDISMRALYRIKHRLWAEGK